MTNYTLKEIARELNVSRATIDRVIHNRGGIGEDTTKMVTEYLKKINYKPNKVGKSLGKRLNKNIYVSFHDTKNEFFEDIKRGIEAAEEEIRDFGFRVSIDEVSRDSKEQISLIRKAISNGIDAIALSPYEPNKFIEVLGEAYTNGVPVVTFNNDIVNSSKLCHIGTNYYNNGRIAGEVMSKIVKSGSVLILRRTSSYWQNQLRIAGFTEVISSYSNIKILGSYGGSIDYNTAYANIKELIKVHPDLKGVLLLNNEREIITGTCDAIKDSLDNIIDIITFDLPSACIQEIKSGNITASICQDPFSQGYYCVKILFKYLFDNIPPEKSIYTTRLDVIYKENLDNYCKDLYSCFFV